MQAEDIFAMCNRSLMTLGKFTLWLKVNQPRYRLLLIKIQYMSGSIDKDLLIVEYHLVLSSARPRQLFISQTLANMLLSFARSEFRISLYYYR